MKRQVLILGLVGFGLACATGADDTKDHGASPPTNASFEMLKKLVGTWVNVDAAGKPTDEVVSVIRLTAAGSALHETLFPGQPHEMISVYTVDGAEVAMTHYCMLGNQPRLKGKVSAQGNQLCLEFVGGTNLDPAKDKHMHSAILTFVDDDHFEVEGIGWEGGKPAKAMCNGMKLARKK